MVLICLKIDKILNFKWESIIFLLYIVAFLLCLGCITSSLSCFTAFFTAFVKPDPTSLDENEQPEELPRPSNLLLELKSFIVLIEVYAFYAMNGLTVAAIVSLYKFLNQSSTELPTVPRNLEVGIYMCGYLAILILLTLAVFKPLHHYILNAFYTEPSSANPDE